MTWRALDIPTHSDSRGKVSVIELGAALPFAPRRVYYLYDIAPAESRGFHAHRKLEQLFFVVGGQLRLILDDGKRRESHLLDRPNRGVYVPAMVWRELHDFTPNTTCIVIASDVFDERDYIRNYDEFVVLAGGRS